MSAQLCIFTPTYQRAHTLPRLYESLLAQTSGSFVWLVVDDGSTDGTEALVAGWAAEGKIAIDYVRTENGGKQRAWNLAAKRCAERHSCELFFNMDSDDYLLPYAVELLLRRWNERPSGTYAGIAALFGRTPGEPLRTGMPKGDASTLWDLEHVYGFRGDLPLIYRTDLMLAHPYVVDPRETFVSEYTASYEIDAEAPLLLLGEIIAVAEYQADGLSANVRALTARNPAGYMRFHKQCVGLARTPYQRWYHESLYLVGCALAREKYGSTEGGWRDLPAGLERPLARLAARVLLPTAFRAR